MPSSTPKISKNTQNALRILGEKIRTQRKRLKVNAVATAESASMSRMTLYRIERGDPSVTIGAYFSVILALGLDLKLFNSMPSNMTSKKNTCAVQLPSTIRVGDYPQLCRLAWQLKKTTQLSPKEALEIYERNWRHIQLETIEPKEMQLIKDILAAFGKERLLV